MALRRTVREKKIVYGCLNYRGGGCQGKRSYLAHPPQRWDMKKRIDEELQRGNFKRTQLISYLLEILIGLKCGQEKLHRSIPE